MENNISTLETPYLVPSQRRISILDDYTRPISMFGFDDFLLVIYRSGTSLYVDYITYDADEDEYTTYTGTLQNGGASSDDEYPRCVVQFNVYDTPTDPVSGKYVKKLLIFPDKKSMDFEITSDDFPIKDMSVLVKEFTPTGDKDTPPDTASHNYYYRNSKTSDVYKWVDDTSDSENSGWKVSVPPAMPDIKYAAVHLSRLFGVDEDRVYASGYNDYTNWNLDTVDEYNVARLVISDSSEQIFRIFLCTYKIKTVSPDPEAIRSLAWLQCADVISSEHFRPSARSHLQQLIAAGSFSSPLQPMQQVCCSDLFHKIAGIVTGRSVHTQPDRDFSFHHARNIHRAAGQFHIGARAVCDLCSAFCDSVKFTVRKMNSVRIEHIAPRPSDRFHIFIWPHAVSGNRVCLFVFCFAQVCMQLYAAPSCKNRALLQQLF